MRRAALHAARAVAVAGPVALAFAAGGYFDTGRMVALAGACAVLAAVAAAAPYPWPRTWPARAAVAGAAGLAAWTWASTAWAPLPDAAGDDAERAALYAVALLAGAALWRPRAAARAVEPLVALGVLMVIGYGLAGRLLPGLVELDASVSAGGRLEQPLTYWNATGALAAMGVLLCARMAGDPDRSPKLRAAAAAGAVPLLCGLYLTFSRGAIAALAGGLLVLVVLAPTRVQLRAIALALVAGAPPVVAAALAPAVRALEEAGRVGQGLGVLAVLLGAMALAAGLTARAARAGHGRPAVRDRLDLPRWAGTAALAATVALVVVPVLAARGADGPQRDPGFGAQTARLGSVGSNRYDYWKVAAGTWADRPLAGAGASGFQVAWLRERPIPGGARDAHSLPLETLSELGLAGGVLLAFAAGGVALCARRVQAADPVLAAGPAAALAAWALHASLDWDWEMPGLTLVALTLAAMLVARGDAPAPAA
jgi:hypothetical protein